MIYHYFFCFMGLWSALDAIEYAYPLFFLPSSTFQSLHCVVLYQNSHNHTELWLWNSSTRIPHKLLLSMYSPAGVCLLPDGSGFSFIDNDRIRIKYFHKRSPKTLEFALPIYDITILQWISPQEFCFSAKEHGSYRLYYGTVNGFCCCIQSISHGNVFYPQKVSDQVFFIKRVDAAYALCSSEFPQEVAKRAYDYEDNEPICIPSIQDLYYFEHPVAFLTMQTSTQGYIISHPQEVERSALYIDFDYCALKSIGSEWQCTKLFTFTIPAELLMAKNDVRFYESMLPLLPKLYNETIYYLDSSREETSLNIYAYSLQTGVSQRMTSTPGIYCSPCPINETIYYGGLINPKIPPMLTLSDNKLLLDLPKF